MLNYPVIYSLSERAREWQYIQGTVFTLARLKIVHCYLQELVAHPMPILGNKPPTSHFKNYKLLTYISFHVVALQIIITIMILMDVDTRAKVSQVTVTKCNAMQIKIHKLYQFLINHVQLPHRYTQELICHNIATYTV